MFGLVQLIFFPCGLHNILHITQLPKCSITNMIEEWYTKHFTDILHWISCSTVAFGILTPSRYPSKRAARDLNWTCETVSWPVIQLNCSYHHHYWSGNSKHLYFRWIWWKRPEKVRKTPMRKIQEANGRSPVAHNLQTNDSMLRCAIWYHKHRSRVAVQQSAADGSTREKQDQLAGSDWRWLHAATRNNVPDELSLNLLNLR